MRALVILLLGFTCPFWAGAQQKALNIPAIHQLVADSRNEHDRQTLARDRQAINLINEAANKTLLARLKNSYREIQGRFNTIGTAIDLLDIGIRAAPMVEGILRDQYKLYEFANRNPAILPLVMQSEIDLLQKSRELLYYLAGLTASIGAINQMKAADRRILFDYVISEISVLKQLAGGLLRCLDYGSLGQLIRSANPFAGFINTDRAIVKEIIDNAKYLKR